MDRYRVLSAFLWKFGERCGAQAIALLVQIILARILSPSDYGTIALLLVFINILQVFVDSGLGNALIQKKEADDLDFSTIFLFNCVLCLVLYALLAIAAPYIASFYHDNSLVSLIRVLGITLFISGLRNVQQAYVARKMLFRLFFISTLIALVVSAVISIGMAYSGYGVWALVAQNLIANGLGTVILWFMADWRPQLVFCSKRFRRLFSFGSKLMLSALLETCYNNLSQLIIGRLYTASDLAFYTQGERFPLVIVSNVNTSISSVLLPSLSQCQDTPERVRHMLRRAMQISSFVMWPLMVGLAVIADSLVPFLLTEKWLPLVPYLQVFCFSYALWPIHTTNLNGINAMGRSDIFLKLEIIKKTYGLLMLFLMIPHGPFAMCCGVLVTGIVSTFVNSYPNRKLLGYHYLAQIRDIAPSALLAIAMGGVIYPIVWLELGNLVTMCFQTIVGMIFYFVFAYLFHLDAFAYIVETVCALRHKA